jgi:predicted phage tail protein
MRTKVFLEGILGDEFGVEWGLEIETPVEALQLINANKPGFLTWIRDNFKRTDGIKIIGRLPDDRLEGLSEHDLLLHRDFKEIYFVPVIEGKEIVSGILAVAYAIGNVAAAAYAAINVSYVLMAISTVMSIAGAAGLFSPNIRPRTTEGGRNVKNEYFDGPINTTVEGQPVSLIYGKNVRVGSQVISVKYEIVT